MTVIHEAETAQARRPVAMRRAAGCGQPPAEVRA